ncbi:hypothetical protein QJS66_04225 [Kocuria rhizophila]|nr:hypothetical protein QJS66_04225 [Kocuria rhizophila]
MDRVRWLRRKARRGRRPAVMPAARHGCRPRGSSACVTGPARRAGRALRRLARGGVVVAGGGLVHRGAVNRGSDWLDMIRRLLAWPRWPRTWWA